MSTAAPALGLGNTLGLGRVGSAGGMSRSLKKGCRPTPSSTLLLQKGHETLQFLDLLLPFCIGLARSALSLLLCASVSPETTMSFSG